MSIKRSSGRWCAASGLSNREFCRKREIAEKSFYYWQRNLRMQIVELAFPSSVTDIMAKKYADGLPLARLEKPWAREGVDLSRATITNWVIQRNQTWLKPLYKQMKQRLL